MLGFELQNNSKQITFFEKFSILDFYFQVQFWKIFKGYFVFFSSDAVHFVYC